MPDEKSFCAVVEGLGTDCLIVDLEAPNTSPDPSNHTDKVTCFAFSEDASLLATGGGDLDRTVRIWDASNGKHLRVLEGRPNAVIHLKFSSDNKRLESASSDGTKCVWEVESGRLLPVADAVSEVLEQREGGEKVAEPIGVLRTQDGTEKEEGGVAERGTNTSGPVDVPKAQDITGKEKGDGEGEGKAIAPADSSPTSVTIARDQEKVSPEPQEKSMKPYTCTPLERTEERGFVWFISFEGGGKKEEIAIPVPNALPNGPIAYCRDRLAFSCTGGNFYLLDVSKVIERIDLPNTSIRGTF